MIEGNSIYHERQSLELCCLHALNNLFQGVAFTRDVLDSICKKLSPDSTLFNPHRSCLGLGNYDVNVLISALNTKDCTAVWFDRRKDPAILSLDKVIGFILNVPSEPWLGFVKVPFMSRRHWIAVREVAGAYYDLNSKLKEPQIIGNEEDVLKFISEALADEQKQVFVVLDKNVEMELTYLRPPYRNRD